MVERDPVRLFHIISRGVWIEANGEEEYRPESLADEGFVHLSYADQVLGVAQAFYRDLADPIAVEYHREDLDDPVVDEDTYGSGQAFPHLYGPLPTGAAVRTHELRRDADGDFVWDVS